MKNINVSFINFAQEVKKYIANSNEKFIKWGADNNVPFQMLGMYDSVPEHSSSINFLEANTVGEGLEDSTIFDYWTLKKLILDYFIFGGFAVKVNKLRNGGLSYEYLDIAKCRFNLAKNKVGYADDWTKYKVELEWYELVTSAEEVKGECIFYFKNNKSREVYPRPHYLPAFRSIETAEAMGQYHNSNAKNGFTPSTIINFNNGQPDDDTKAQIHKDFKENFTGPNASRFLLTFNDTKEAETTISKLDNDNLDQKFADLQKWIQNQIIMSHQITSGQLIGVRPENQGFSKTEYSEAMEIFKDVVIKGFRNEIEYALGKMTGKIVKIKESDSIDEPESTEEITENNDTNKI